MQFDPYPHIPDELKSHALALTIGRWQTTPAIIQRLDLRDWLAVLAVFIECETKRILREYGEDLQPLPQVTETPVLASQLIQRWKHDEALQTRFESFAEYVAVVESMLEGVRPMESALLP